MLSADGPADEVGAQDRADALVAALIDLEHHIGEAGWDQAPRLFALVSTDTLVAAEPTLAAELGLRTAAEGAAPGGLTAIEQEWEPTGDVVADLEGIVWPESVDGCAVSMESSFVPPDAEADLPDDPAAVAAAVAEHPARTDVRLVAGVDRWSNRHGVGRVVTAPDELLGAPDLVPVLTTALAHTLEPTS